MAVSETDSLLPLLGISLSWFSRLNCSVHPLPAGDPSEIFGAPLSFPPSSGTRWGVHKSTFQSITAWTGDGTFPPTSSAMLNSLLQDRRKVPSPWPPTYLPLRIART